MTWPDGKDQAEVAEAFGGGAAAAGRLRPAAWVKPCHTPILGDELESAEGHLRVLPGAGLAPVKELRAEAEAGERGRSGER